MINEIFRKIATKVSTYVASPWAFLLAMLTVIIWILVGPIFNYSDSWQLVINTGTTIVTFLMVFLIQQTQNKDSKAVELKLNELVASTKGASNRLIDVESLTEEELDVLHGYFQELVTLAKKDKGMTDSHSIEEAQRLHTNKQR